MHTYTILDAVQDCDTKFIILDFKGCAHIETAAVEKIVSFIRTHEGVSILVDTDDHIKFQLEALRRLLREENAAFSYSFAGLLPLPLGFHQVLRETNADIAIYKAETEDVALLSAIGEVERSRVHLRLPPSGKRRLLQCLRRTKHLHLDGLRYLDYEAAAGLLEGNTDISHFGAEQIEGFCPKAAELVGQVPLEWLSLGPVISNSLRTDGWLASKGVIQLTGLHALSEDEADRLATSAASCLALRGPINLSTASSRRLVQFPRTLSITDLTSLPVAMARGLQGWREKLLIQTAIFEPKAANWMHSEHGELELSIGINNGEVDEAAIIALAKNGGQQDLKLTLLTEHILSDCAAAALASRPGKIGIEIYAVGSGRGWKELSRLTGSLSVSKVQLNPEISKCIISHHGPLELGLDRMPTVHEAALLSQHCGRKLTLNFNPDDSELTGEIAMHLANYSGELTLCHLTALDTASLRVLELRRGGLRILSFTESEEMQAAISHLEKEGALLHN